MKTAQLYHENPQRDCITLDRTLRPERMAERAQWIATYEEKAKAFASCTFLEAVGSGAIHPKVAPVIALHDKESRATIQGNAVA
jgi:hypothetical protein